MSNSYEQKLLERQCILLDSLGATLGSVLWNLTQIREGIETMAKATTTNTSIGYSEEIGDEDLYASRGNKVEISQSQSRQSKGVGPKAPRPGCGKGGK